MTIGITPLEYKVIVKPDAVEKTTAGGIIMPDEVHDRENSATARGELIDVSPLAFTYDEYPEGFEMPQIGERVLFAPFVGKVVKGNDGAEYRIINDKDIIGVER